MATINPSSQSVPASGASNQQVLVTMPTGCGWTASSGVQWITVTQGATGSGNGTVSFNIAANVSPQRTGTLTIAGHVFSVTQANGCTYSITPASHNFNQGGGSLTVTVTTGPGCTWTATESLTWATITNGASGTGTGTVTIVVAAFQGGNGNGNANGLTREGTVLIAGRTLTIRQEHD